MSKWKDFLEDEKRNPKPDDTVWVMFESGKYEGQKWLPLDRLKEMVEVIPDNVDDFCYNRILPGNKIPDRFREDAEEKMNAFLAHHDETTELWWYDDIGILCGSNGYALVRKDDRTKLVDAHILMRA